jgi:hypothetical protein
MFVPLARDFFHLTPLTDVGHWLLLGIVVVLAYGLSLWSDRLSS